MNAQLVSRARGALLGLVAGNQLGVPTEHLGTPDAIREAFPQGVRDLAPPPKNSPYDDDAAMTLLLGESLLAGGGFDAADASRRWVKWMKVDGRGIGITTRRAPVALRFHDDVDRLIRVSTERRRCRHAGSISWSVRRESGSWRNSWCGKAKRYERRGLARWT
jgi:ADP-ribosylglycohydrolase